MARSTSKHLHDEISPTWDLHHQMRNTDATFPEFRNWHHNNAPERS
jgi:hypothetical protein